MRDYEAVAKQAKVCASRKYCDIGGNCEYYDLDVCCQDGEKDILKDAADAIEELLRKMGAKNSAIEFGLKRIENLQAENEQLKDQVPTWISVEERLPEDRQDVLCLLENKVVRILKFSPVQTTWFPQGFSYEHNGMNIRQTGNNVTHWMPLPTSPGGTE